MQTVALIDYGSGNVHSAQKALERAAGESGAEANIRLLADPDAVRRADRIVLPGVGAFADCRHGLDAADGMVAALREAVVERGVPFLGICVGMQLMATRGLEFGETPGLGWISGDVAKIESADDRLKIPHMGWNTLRLHRSHAVFEGIEDGADGWHAYFVHSFHMTGVPDDHVLATAEYGAPITAAVARDNLVGTQFHPEKSQKLGLKLLANFLNWSP